MTKFSSSLLTFLLITNAYGLTLRESVEKTISTNPEILAAQKKQDAFRKYVDEEKADYLPTIDLESYYEYSYKHTDANNTPDEYTHKDGWNATLEIEQILYDGGLTPSEVSEQKYRFSSNEFKSNLETENIILDTTNSFLDMAQYQELLSLSNQMIKVQEKNLVTAKEQEAISGEKIEVLQVLSKLHFTTDRYLKQEDSELEAKNTFKKLSGITPTDLMCRPTINERLIPKTLEQTVELAIKKHYAILEQIEKIKMQREKLAQANAEFLPTLSFQLEGEWDNDLLLFENGRQDLYKAKLFMSWNISKGGKNLAQSEKEKLFLQEAKKTLDAKTAEIIADITKDYNSYYKTKQRVDVLKLSTQNNVEILNIYRKEFDAGTRTFIDILNAEAEVYSAKTSLITGEFELYKHYYSLLLNLSILSDYILSKEERSCINNNSTNLFTNNTNNNKELEQIFDETPINNVNNLSNSETKIDQLETQKPIKNNTLKKEQASQSTLTPQRTPAEPILESDSLESEPTEKIVVSPLLRFMDASPEYFTIDITTQSDKLDALYILNKYSLEEGYTFEFGDKLEEVKVLYGVYPTSQEAQEALKKLDAKLIKQYTPRVANIQSYQALYNKTHNPSNKDNQEKQIKVSPKSNSSLSTDVVTPPKLITTPKQSTKKVVLSPFIRFIDAPSTYFTINVTTKKEKLDALYILNKYDLEEGYTFNFGDNLEKVKVLYGVYPTSQDAQSDLKKLDNRLIKKYSPYVENIHKYQTMYNQAHNPSKQNDQKKQTTVSTKPKNSISTQVTVPTEPVIAQEKSAKKVVLSPFIRFVDAPSTYFTINVATKKEILDALYIFNRYDMVDEGYTFKFGDNLEKVKVLYGIYETSKEAKDSLKKLDQGLINKYSPYVENIQKYQTMYHNANSNVTEETKSSNTKKKENKVSYHQATIPSSSSKLGIKDMLDTSSQYFTLNIATKNSVEEANNLLERYDLIQKGYFYNLGGKNVGKVKILYGIYPNSKAAKQALKQLNKILTKRYAPYVDNVIKHQKLYEKYQSVN